MKEDSSRGRYIQYVGRLALNSANAQHDPLRSLKTPCPDGKVEIHLVKQNVVCEIASIQLLFFFIQTHAQAYYLGEISFSLTKGKWLQ
ncbi:uncharacterized protein TrAFT101_006729 [Trichoderma asperellum]|uniref:uncharacterized protein n=1 Tax=Trichoderma asperellum TaxID=101201 RepID=UPI00332A1A84|nr:hypothetical protein TrAFT101_006729 [Trichoderma asperellum]